MSFIPLFQPFDWFVSLPTYHWHFCIKTKKSCQWRATVKTICQWRTVRRVQGAKKIIFTACLSGKLKLEFTSPDVILNSPKPFWRAELISQFFCYSNSSKSITCPSGKLKTEFTCPIAKSTSPGLSDTTFFARCSQISFLILTVPDLLWE